MPLLQLLPLYRIWFNRQRSGAKKRGIAWELTFPQWLEWWGADIERRGRRSGQLAMCRFKDEGAYALGNIYKGTPAQNGLDRRLTPARRKRLHEASLDALQPTPKKEYYWDQMSEDEAEIDKMMRVRTSSGLYN